jgi:hypothetical protein
VRFEVMTPGRSGDSHETSADGEPPLVSDALRKAL